MKKLLFFSITILLFFSSAISVFAAEYPLTGPNIVIEIEVNQNPIYVTLLCETKDPLNDLNDYMSWPSKYTFENFDSVDLKMKEYAESNDYYYVDTLVQLNNNYSTLEWYGTTSSFKILIYHPDTDSFIISDCVSTESSYLNAYSVHYDENIHIESVHPYPALLPLCIFALISSFLIRLILSFLFKHHQSTLFNVSLIEKIAVSLLYSAALAVMTYYYGKNAFIICIILCFLIFFNFEYLFFKFALSIHSYCFLYVFICNLLHCLLSFHVFNSYIW